MGPRGRSAPRRRRAAGAARSRATGGWLALRRSSRGRVPRRRRPTCRVSTGSGATTRKELLDRRKDFEARGAASGSVAGGAPARLRRRDPRPARAAAERLVLGDADQAARAEPVPARARSRRASSPPLPGRARVTRRTRSRGDLDLVHWPQRSARRASAGRRVRPPRRSARPSPLSRGAGRASSSCCSRSASAG